MKDRRVVPAALVSAVLLASISLTSSGQLVGPSTLASGIGFFVYAG